MKLSVGRSGVDLGAFEFEMVRDGLKSGLFLDSDYGWFEGMLEWHPLPSVIKNLSTLMAARVRPPTKIPANASWTKDAATPKQIRFMKKRGIKYPANCTKGQAAKIIASQPEAVRKLSSPVIDLLKSHGFDPFKISYLECMLRLENIKHKLED